MARLSDWRIGPGHGRIGGGGMAGLPPGYANDAKHCPSWYSGIRDDIDVG